MDSIPQVIGTVDIPQEIERRQWRRSQERARLVREIVASLEPGRAVEVRCPDRDEMQTFRCHVLVLGRRDVATRSRGLTLYVYLKAKQLVMGEVLNV